MNETNPPIPPNDSTEDAEKLAYEPPEELRPASAAPTEGQLERELPTVKKKLDYSPAPAAHDPYAAFRVRSYQVFIGTLLFSTLAMQILSVALQWELAKKTNDPLMLGYLGGLQALPIILLALPAGHVSDTYSRKGVLVITQIMLAICPAILAALVYFGSAWPHYLAAMFAVVLINAVALTFSRPARQAYLPQLVPTAVFPNAVTWNSTTFELASMTGPAIGGLIIARWDTTIALVTSAVFGVLCLLCTLLLPSIAPPSKREPLNFHSLAAGVKYVFRHDYLLPALTLDLFAVLFGGAVFLLPFFATQRLHVGSFGFGLLRAAPSIGAVSMALIIAHLPPMQHAGRFLLLAVVGFGAATIVFGLSTNFWLSMAMLYLTGAFDNISVVVRHTLVQLMTPNDMRGRVSAVNLVFIGSSNELGGLESGVTARWLGLVQSVVYGGIGTIIVVAAIALRWPKMRKFGSLHDAGAKSG